MWEAPAHVAGAPGPALPVLGAVGWGASHFFQVSLSPDRNEVSCCVDFIQRCLVPRLGDVLPWERVGWHAHVEGARVRLSSREEGLCLGLPGWEGHRGNSLRL